MDCPDNEPERNEAVQHQRCRRRGGHRNRGAGFAFVGEAGARRSERGGARGRAELGSETEFATDEIAAQELYWLEERISGGETPTAFGSNNSGTGVGGSTLHWGAFVPRPDPRDLSVRTEFGAGADWPVSYKELLPYFEQVEDFLGVSGPAVYPWNTSRQYPLPAVGLNAPAEAMQRGFGAIGLRTSAAPIAAVSRDYERPGYPIRHACVNRGYCHQGCRNGAKASMDVTYLPVAVSAGAEIRADSFAHGLEMGNDGRIAAVVYEHEGVDVRQRCRAVFLCAGAVETPRLLLHCGGRDGSGLANSSGQVGRNFMAHVATQVWERSPRRCVRIRDSQPR